MAVFAHWRESTGDFVEDNKLALGVTGVTLIVALAMVVALLLIVRRK